MSILLESSRIMTNWERVQCVGYMCCLWCWVDPCSNPRTSFPRHISWNMLPRFLKLWSPKMKKEDGNTSTSLLKPGTWVILDFSFSTTRSFGLYLQIYPLLSKSSTTILYPTTTISNLEYTINFKQLSPTFALVFIHSILHKTAKAIFFNINQIFHLSA